MKRRAYSITIMEKGKIMEIAKNRNSYDFQQFPNPKIAKNRNYYDFQQFLKIQKLLKIVTIMIFSNFHFNILEL